VAKTEAPKPQVKTEAPKTAGQAAAPKKDFFSDIKKNVFEAIKNNLPKLKDLGQKLLNDPNVKAALGDKDPSKIIDAARDFAKGKINEKLANAEFKLPKFEKAAEGGKNLPQGLDSKAFVQKGLSEGARGLDIKPTTTGSKEVTLSDSQKAAADKAGSALGKVQDGFAKAQELAKLAEKVGIKVPSYDKSAEVGSTKNLYTSADGKGKVDLNTNAKGTFHAGVDGVKAHGEAGVNVTATRSDGVSTSGKYGTADASYTATATAGAKATGDASLGADGLKAKADLRVGVSAEVKGQAKVESKPIGGVPGLTAYAGVEGQVKVGAEAYATGEVALTKDKAVVKGEAGAFAGVEAKVTGRAGVGPLGVTGTAAGWAGVGAKAEFNAGYENGKLKLSFGAGAALGYGGYLKGGVEIDVGKAKQIAEHVVDKVADGAKKLADADGDGKLSINDAKVAAQKVGSAVESGVKKATEAVGGAINKVGQGISNVGKGISNFAKKFSIF
jgi:hypothetical protein